VYDYCQYITKFDDAEGVYCAGRHKELAGRFRVFPMSQLDKEMPMSKRELIDTGTDKRYVRRDEDGRFKESDDVGKSLSQDVRKSAKNASSAGQGDKGDRKA